MVRYAYFNETKTLVRAYSDKDFKIQKVGTDEIYDDAVDVFDHIDSSDNTPRGIYKYIETNNKKEVVEL